MGRLLVYVHDAGFDPSEPRAASGEWTAGGSSHAVTAMHDPPVTAKLSAGEPRKTKIAYKQFRLGKDKKLYPLFISNKTPTTEGDWIAAKIGHRQGFAPRPGWHSGELPIGRQLWSHDPMQQRQPDRVWAEVEIPDDVDWQSEAAKTGGELLDRVPAGGNYRFVEKGKAGRGTPWYISGALKVRRRLSDEDVRDILHRAGKDDMIGPETRYKYGSVGGETFASPNVFELPPMSATHAISTAQAQLASRRHKLFQAAAEDIDLSLGISNKAEKSAIGAWKDGAEGTTMMIAPGATPDQLRLSAAMKGWLGQQKAVLSFAANPNGKGIMYSAQAKGALDDIHRQLLAKGLENHTLVPTSGGATIYIADTDGSLAQDVASYAKAYPTKFRATPGDAEFIGATHYEGTSDAEQRAEGRKAYEALIAASGDRVGAADWRRIRDRWASPLETTHDRAPVRRTYRQAELSGEHAPAKGDLFYVFRAGSDAERQVENRDAGNALGVAEHLAMLDDRTSVKPANLLGGGPTCVHLYAVILHELIGRYQAIVGGTTPGLGIKGIGYRTHGGAAAISFGPEGLGYTARHVMSFPLREVRAELKRATGLDDFSKAGWPAVADAIHAVAARRGGTHDRGRVIHVHVGDQEVFVEAEHPRRPHGPGGGEFTKKGTGVAGASGVHVTTPHVGPKLQVHVHPPMPPLAKPERTQPESSGKPALAGSKGHPATISTALISAKTSPVNSNATYTQTGLAAMKADPASFAKSMELLKSPEMYPYFRGLHGTPEEIAEQAITQMVANLKYFAANAPPLTKRWGTAWYREENEAAKVKAAETGLPLASVAGAYAALSPQNDWNMNVYQGDVVIDAVLNQQKTPWSDRMEDVSRQIGRTALTRKMLDKVRGKRLEEIESPVEQAMWIRVWNEATSDRFHRLFRPDGKLGDWARKNDGGKQPATWKTLGAIANAIKSIKSGGDREIISQAMGGANKVRSFYNNILDPESANGDITVDTHAIGADLFDAIGGSTAPVMHGLGMSPEADKKPAGWQAAPNPAKTGVAGLYGLHAEAYRRAARDLGLRPLELQSLTWEAKRALFEHMPAKAKQTITGIWRDYHAGKGTLEEAQKAVVAAAGGFKEPDWTRAPHDD